MKSHGLREEVVGPPPHGLDGLGDVPVAGDDDNGDIRAFLPKFGNPIEAVAVREVQV
ncbi:MAG: hypothetical protein NZ742_02935 [Acidobacteria bacterium]|nr:hypothetical protein [Acidobacteriota bacterium]MDW7983533.1 hypothetical protein [Acidobacteriota bacterium]